MKILVIVAALLSFTTPVLADKPTKPMLKSTVIMQDCMRDNTCSDANSKSTSRKQNANGNIKDNQKSTSRKENANGNMKDRHISTSRKVNANTPQ